MDHPGVLHKPKKRKRRRRGVKSRKPEQSIRCDKSEDLK